MEQPKYHIDLFWSDEDDGYIANVPALRYCSAFGETYEEALSEVLVAMELHLETLRELNRPIPEPTSPAPPGSSELPNESDLRAIVTHLDRLNDPALWEDLDKRMVQQRAMQEELTEGLKNLLEHYRSQKQSQQGA
jgi:predicted RNase H-like HicB family nuclease